MRVLVSLILSISLCLWVCAAWAAPQPGPERSCAPGLISGPPDFTQPAYACGRCHGEQNSWVKRSLMATASGIINQTRFLWGAQENTGPRFATAAIGPLQLLPTFEDSGALVDDLLRRRCLRCHLGAAGPIPSGGPPEGALDGKACAACHILTGSESIASDQKLPESGDQARTNLLTTAVPTSQCLHCHSGNRVGADYAGLFERDHSTSYNFEASDPDRVPHLYSHAYHFLQPDIHYERGLHCIDCHPVEELMGEGTIQAHSREQVGIRCTDCHGLPDKLPQTRRVKPTDTRALRAARANPNYDLQPGQRVIVTSKGHLLTNTREANGKFLLVSKVDGKKHEIPILARESPKTGPLDHRIPGHLENLECATCHAAWTFQDLGLHLTLQEDADYDPWLWLTRQADPQVQQVLEEELVKSLSQRNLPTSFDYITGRSSPGLWLAGYSRRRWEGVILGVNDRGLVSALRPHYQYWVSRVDPGGRVLRDSTIPTTATGRAALAWTPYTPHTIRRQTAACWDCHGNPRALGLGQRLIRAKDAQPQGLTRPIADGLGIEFELDQVIDGQGRPLQITTQPKAAFLDRPRLERMSASNPLYVKYLLEYYVNKEAYGNPQGFTGPKK